MTLTNQGTRPPQPENPKGNSRDREMSQGISQKLGIPKAQQDLYKLLKVNINFELLLCNFTTSSENYEYQYHNMGLFK